MKNTYEKFNIQIGKKIMKKRLQRGYTREYLAEMADISAKFLYEIEICRLPAKTATCAIFGGHPGT